MNEMLLRKVNCLKIYYLFIISGCLWRSICDAHHPCVPSAGEDASGSAVPGAHLRSLAVFRCSLLLANEREEAHMDLPCM